MQFVKTHLISLLCGVAALAFLGVTVWGMTRDDVVKELENRVQSASVINTLQSSPVNQDIIEAERLRGQKFEQEYQATMKVAHDMNRRTPLIEGVFPKADRPSTIFTFVDEYRRTILGFANTLLASGPPTAAEIEEERQNVADLIALEAELKTEKDPTTLSELAQGGGGGGGRSAPVVNQPPVVAPGGAPVVMSEGGGRMGAVGMRPGFGTQQYRAPQSPDMSTPTGEPKYDPILRARVSKARGIRCYADMFSFHVSPIAQPSGDAPPPEELWFAQVGLWIQQDIVKAIGELNNQAALKVEGDDAYVQQMPVKRIGSVRIHGYQLKGGNYLDFTAWSGERTSGGSSATPTSFTGREPDDQFDVLHFTLAVYVDERDLLKVIDAISRQNFYNCIGVKYSKPPAEDSAQGYMYGTEPVVRAELAFEGYMARSVYAPLMPKPIRDMLGIQKDPNQP